MVTIKRLNECSAPKCKDSSEWTVALENGKIVLQVCDRHVSWGKIRAQDIENS